MWVMAACLRHPNPVQKCVDEATELVQRCCRRSGRGGGDCSVRFRVGESWFLPTCANFCAIPLIVFSIPIYLMYQQAHLLDTRFGLALILCLVNLPLVLVLLANATQDLPVELEEAARIDGASTWGVLLLIVLPLLRPIVAASAVLAFIYSWNEFLFGLMLTTSVAVPVTVGASFFFSAS